MGKNNIFLIWMASVFVLLSLVFIFNLWDAKPKRIDHPIVEEKFYTKDTLQNPYLEAKLLKDGEVYRCQECHETMEASTVQKSFYSAHKDVVLKHGVNQSCRTCHSPTDKEKLLDIMDKHVAFNQSELTCLKCHGPIYRDWEKGVHGRMKDYWDPKKKIGAEKITCVACHNPHQPSFPMMEPAPGPYRYQYEGEEERVSPGETKHER